MIVIPPFQYPLGQYPPSGKTFSNNLYNSVSKKIIKGSYQRGLKQIIKNVRH